MKTSTLRIALAQVNPILGCLDYNRQKTVACIHAARAKACDLVAFPELSLCGYPPEDLLQNRQFLADCQSCLRQIANECNDITVIFGFPEYEAGKVYNSLVIINHRSIAAIYRKIELPNYGVFDEKRYFQPGAQIPFFSLNDITCMPTICEDIWVPGNPCCKTAARQRAGLVFNISASPFHAGKLQERKYVLADFSRRTGAAVAYVNLVGGQDELVFDGGSIIMKPDGTTVAQSPRFIQDLLIADITVPVSPANTKAIMLKSAKTGVKPRLIKPVIRSLDSHEEIYQALVLGTRDYTLKNGFTKAVLGLSGGIDSALTAAIAVDALGRENVIGVTMPSRYTSKGTYQDALALSRNLGIECLVAPIRPLVKQYLQLFSKLFKSVKFGIEAENIQARIRGNILMALSNRHGYLVLTTGNKSEVSTGYCTLYGDTAGGLAVIKDVPKTMVYSLTALVNRNREIIPQSIINRTPTAELKFNQTDQDTLPPYPELDAILHDYIEDVKPPGAIVKSGHDRRTVSRVIAMVDRSEYKRRQSPPGIKITPRAFGRDRRLPITNRYRPAL